MAGRYFSSRSVHCGCIPKRLSCDHKFPNQANGDPVYIFLKEIQKALREMSISKISVHSTLKRLLWIDCWS
jgi:hypothetical protein